MALTEEFIQLRIYEQYSYLCKMSLKAIDGLIEFSEGKVCEQDHIVASNRRLVLQASAIDQLHYFEALLYNKTVELNTNK